MSAPASHSADTASALSDRVAHLESAQRREDVDAFVELFDSDAVWVSGGGVRLVGRDAIADFTRDHLPGSFADGSVHYVVDRVDTIAPDVAITSIDQEYLDAEGRPLDPRRQGRPTYVWRRDGGRWLIVHGQNTLVMP